MADPKWQEIYATRPQYSPVSTRHDVPRVSKPVCPEHCSGRHEPEGIVQCPSCQVPAYKVMAHEWLYNEGHWFYELIPMNGSKPSTGETPVCTCGKTMTRTL